MVNFTDVVNNFFLLYKKEYAKHKKIMHSDDNMVYEMTIHKV